MTPAWMADAACRGYPTEKFFPHRGDNYGVRDAKAICYTCPVRLQCLEWAIKNHEKVGVWGGTAEYERRRLRRVVRRRARTA